MIGVELLDALPVAIYTTDERGQITYFNEAAADFWGRRPQLGSDQWCGSWRLYWPDGRPLSHEECPLAVALREGRPVRGVEAIAERPDGSKVRFLPYPTPLWDASGRLVGAINLLVDLTERYRSDLEAARLAAIVTSSDDAIISKTLDGRVTSWNTGATRIFGYTAEEMIGQSITRIIPPELHQEEKVILARLSRGEHIDHYETVRVAKDGRPVDISLTVSPLRDKFGAVIGASKVGRDITERKQAEKLQGLLTNELNHRVKNTLATVQALASQSLLHTRNRQDFVASFGGRVRALARAHDLLTNGKLQGATIQDLVRDQVLFGAADDNRISCSGPVLMLDAQLVVHLALVLHELATNARKYGALSVPGGRLSIQWEMRASAGRTLFMEWTESGVPTITTPKNRGFGSSLIEQTLSAHGGEATIRYGAEGLICRIAMPLSEKVRPGVGCAGIPPEIQPRASSASSQSVHSLLQDRGIIIVEDEPLVAMDLESILTAEGCNVVGIAGTVDKARALIAQARCDAALLDVNLAGHPVDELATALLRETFRLHSSPGMAGRPPRGGSKTHPF